MYSLFFKCLFIIQWVINAGMKPEQEEVTCQDSSELNSFLWTLKRNPPSYFFGTIHVPYTRVWDYIPENTKVAFEESEDVIFELDLTNPYTISALANCQLLPRGEKLVNILPQDIYLRLKKHIEYVRSMMPAWMTADQRGMGLYADYLFNAIAGNWERKRPVWVMLMVNSLTESDIKSRGIPVLDLYLAQEAEKIGKVTGAVERVEEQCVPLNELNFSQVVFALNQTLYQHEVSRSAKRQMRYTTEDLIHHYNCGDLNAIIFNHDSAPVPNLVNNSLPPQDLQTAKLIDEYFRDELINKRNERMAERVINLLKAHPHKSFFFAFGAGHFLGNDTVIDKLIKADYVIEHTPPDVNIPRSKLSRKKKRRRKKYKDRKPYDYTLGDFWFQMDADSRSWIGRTTKNGRKYNRNRDQPFNDLWIRMDNYDPNLLTALAKKFGYKEDNKNNTEDQQQQQQDYNLYSSASVLLSDFQLLLVGFVIVLLRYRLVYS